MTGVSLILNEQTLVGDGIGNLAISVNAIHLRFNGFASLLGVLDGDIIVSLFFRKVAKHG